jgi:GT2 family glycosyltransferase
MTLPNLIVPVLNNYYGLQTMVDSIDYPVARLLIIDNGGHADPAITYETEYVERVSVVSLPSNLGVSGSWNLGVKLLPHDRVWHFTSDDVVFHPGGLANLAKAKPGELTLSRDWPYWHTFALGEDIVRRVGLFDERLYPAYFEDNDYLARCAIAGVDTAITFQDIHARHNNSTTLNSDETFKIKNAVTFQANSKLYQRKLRQADTTWGWDLDRRRAGEWLVD